MKKIKLNSILTNSENETTSVETTGDYDVENNKIIYKEEELEIIVTILKDCVKMNRRNEDYDLNLEFNLSEKQKCKYKVKSVGLDIELIVDTKKLEIKDNYIYAEYSLKNDEVNIGTFEYKLMFWE
jgi:hypothetical protein